MKRRSHYSMSDIFVTDTHALKIDELRRNVRETTEKELIREALRARSFSGADTLRQGMNLIDFAIWIKKDDGRGYFNKNYISTGLSSSLQ